MLSAFAVCRTDEVTIGAHESGPDWAADQERHRHQISLRPRHLRERLFGYAALCVSRSTQDSSFSDGGFLDLGSSTTFVLSRHWGRNRRGRPQEVILLRGYKTRVDSETGALMLGGPRRCVVAYDLRYTPYPDAVWSGKILSARKRTTLRIGLDLDAAVAAAAGGASPDFREWPELPHYWLGFSKDCLPEFEDTPALRKAALRAVYPGYAGPLLPCLRSPGGTITDLERADDGVHILFDDVRVAALPRYAVLYPWVRVGMSVASGTPLGDFLPRRHYGGWRQVARLLGEHESAWLLREVAAASDMEHGGLVCRRYAFAPTQARQAIRVFEDVRHLLGQEDAPAQARIQVWPAGSPGAFRFSADGLAVDLRSVRPEWELRFQALSSGDSPPQKSAGRPYCATPA